ncbi:transcriptional regulator [Algoriphagus namhaensis]
MNRLLTLLLFFASCISGTAQVKFTSRAELPSEFYDPVFELIRLEDGILAFRTIPQKGLNFNYNLQVIQLDMNLNTDRGLLEFPVRAGFDLKGYDLGDGFAYFLFQKGYTADADKYIFKLDLENYKGYEFSAENLLDLNLLEFLVEDDKVIFMGDSDGRPVIQIYDLLDKSIHTVQGVYGNDTEILQIQKLPLIDALQVVISRRGQYRNREILINTYDLLGNLLREVKVEEFGDDNQEIMDGLLLPPMDYQQAMIGSFGIDRRDSYQGMYLMDINEFGEFDFKTYTLVDFPNFYNYLPEKMKERKDREILKNEEKGRSNTIRNIYSIRSVTPTADAYYIYFDHYNIVNARGSAMPGVYRPGRYYRYDQFNRMGYSPFFDDNMGGVRYPNNPLTAQVTTEFKYISAHFIKLGREGNVIWDNSSTFDDFGTTYPQPFGEVAVVDNKFYHMYVKNLILKLSYFKNGERIFENQDFEIKLVDESQRIRDTNAGSLQVLHWYGPFYLLSGNQRVRFLNDEGKEETKEVFFLTKIQVEGDLYEVPEDLD